MRSSRGGDDVPPSAEWAYPDNHKISLCHTCLSASVADRRRCLGRKLTDRSFQAENPYDPSSFVPFPADFTLQLEDDKFTSELYQRRRRRSCY